jgi:hypothetical protein
LRKCSHCWNPQRENKTKKDQDSVVPGSNQRWPHSGPLLDICERDEALGMNTCPMEGFDNRRLSRYLDLSDRHHEIVMVIALGKKSSDYNEPPQWRRPLDVTVTVL